MLIVWVCLSEGLFDIDEAQRGSTRLNEAHMVCHAEWECQSTMKLNPWVTKCKPELNRKPGGGHPPYQDFSSSVDIK